MNNQIDPLGLSQGESSSDADDVPQFHPIPGTDLEQSVQSVDETKEPQNEVPEGELYNLNDLVDEGVILNALGEPFSDFQTADHQARASSRQLGMPCFVRSISESLYVVQALQRLESKSDADTSAGRGASQPIIDDEERHFYTPLEELTLDDFPADHPVRDIGIERFRTLAGKKYKFKQSYRSLYYLFLFAAIGLLVYAFPVEVFSLLGEEAVRATLSQIPEEKLLVGLRFSGAGLFLYCLFKGWVERQYHRFMFEKHYIVHEQGIIKRKTTKTSYANILTHEVDQNPLERVFNWGTIEISTAASDGAELFMHNVYSPKNVDYILEHRKQQATNQK